MTHNGGSGGSRTEQGAGESFKNMNANGRDIHDNEWKCYPTNKKDISLPDYFPRSHVFMFSPKPVRVEAP